MLGQMTQVLAHLGRTGRTVEPDHVDTEGFECGQCGTDLAADEHGARRLDGDVGDDRDADAEAVHRMLTADDRGFDLQ